MNRFDFYSGEPVMGSPNFMTSTTNMSVTDSNINSQQMFYSPGSYGYNNLNSFMNPPQQGFSGFVGNPAFEIMRQNNMYNPYGNMQQFSYTDQVVHVPGFNMGSEVMLTPDAEEICTKLQFEMMVEQEEAIEKRNQRFQGYFNNNYGGYNYYGTPYFNYTDQSVTMKYRKIIDDMKQEAIERRRNFNKNLSRIAHNFAKDDITDEDIDRIYDGYTYTVPASQIKNQVDVDRFSRMQPINQVNPYAKNSEEVSKFYKSILGDDCGMQRFFEAQGEIKFYNDLEEEYHRRRDASQYYQGDSYKRFLRKSIKNRNNSYTETDMSNNIPMGSAFPTLNNSAQMLEDGSLSIRVPDWLKSGQSHMQFNNELEQHFEENRNRFLQSIYAQERENNGA